MRFLLCLGLIAACAVATADDGYFDGIGGSMIAVKKHPTIRMVSEEIHVKLPDCKVAVDFVFKNEGPATSVRMGFPENGEHSAPKQSAFSDFKTWVDGKRFKAERLVHETPGPDEDGEYEIYWVKTVPFQAGQTRRVRVEYVGGETINNGKETNKPYYYQGEFFRYILTTGGSWKGPIGHVRIVADISGMADMSSLQFNQKAVRTHGSIVVWEQANLNPKKDDDFEATWFNGFTDLTVNGQTVFPQDGTFHEIPWDKDGICPPEIFGHEVFVPLAALPFWTHAKVSVKKNWAIVQVPGETHRFKIFSSTFRPSDGVAAKCSALAAADQLQKDIGEGLDASLLTHTFISLRHVTRALRGKYTFDTAERRAYATFPQR